MYVPVRLSVCSGDAQDISPRRQKQHESSFLKVRRNQDRRKLMLTVFHHRGGTQLRIEASTGCPAFIIFIF